jgi:hypothetical protein
MKMPITKDQLAAACRAQDNLADIGTAMGDILKQRGIDPADALYVAEQRALRMVLVLENRLKEVDQTKLSPVSLSARERKVQAQFATIWLDGLVAGVKTGKESK